MGGSWGEGTDLLSAHVSHTKAEFSPDCCYRWAALYGHYYVCMTWPRTCTVNTAEVGGQAGGGLNFTLVFNADTHGLLNLPEGNTPAEILVKVGSSAWENEKRSY